MTLPTHGNPTDPPYQSTIYRKQIHNGLTLIHHCPTKLYIIIITNCTRNKKWCVLHAVQIITVSHQQIFKGHMSGHVWSDTMSSQKSTCHPHLHKLVCTWSTDSVIAITFVLHWPHFTECYCCEASHISSLQCFHPSNMATLWKWYKSH